MHRALHIEEILLNIFGQCYSTSSINRQRPPRATIDLAALVRTCRTFKEPALDVLWTELVNLSPLARCLPEASHRIYPGYTWYSFSRPLKPAEWATLRNYTRRVRSVLDFTRGLNWDSVKTLFNPPTPEPMFPNLRVLRWEFIRETFPLMHHLAVPSLTSLEINFVFGDVPPFHSFPQSLGDLCPNIRRFRIRMRRPQVGSDEAISSLIRHWTNLQVVYCPYISLDSDCLSHLSRTPLLSSLSFALSAAVADHIISSASILLFSKLRDLEIYSQSLEPISRLLTHTRLSTVESLTVYIDSCPPKHVLRAYLTTVQKSCSSHSLVCLKLLQARSPSSTNHGLERYHLTIDDIRPCMAFDQLRRMDINIASAVNLTDKDILELASASPHLEYLLINEEWGWRTMAGITPDGLLQLLRRLKSLHHFCLAVDTWGYTKVSPALESARMVGFIPRMPLSVNVADSAIHPESVGALADFFGGIMQQHVDSSSWYWSTSAMADRLDSEISRKLWEDVFVKAQEKARTHAQSSPTISQTSNDERTRGDRRS
ncbi:hypothetical protein L210DRAFT_3649820 [Boletus edulis BED1]|uniref:F-box domain-containing protein n=1 Tax=Boletus edulis BED1 TaxID=1328754 RepID=A0AAD4BKV2_BOLED|nr:hypothetical protein L210DRAFT_3649820 [Boletus edulis BED1]